jgi:hypothetical protein
MRAAFLLDELVFYFGGLSPRSFFTARLVCKAWSALLVQDRFWRRPLLELHPRIAPLLGPLPAERIFAWYAEMGYRIRTFFDGTVECDRDQQLWEAMLLAGLIPAWDVQLSAVGGSQCLTRVERNGQCVVVALMSRDFEKYELELRSVSKKRRKTQSLFLHLWCGDEAKESSLMPHAVSGRLLALVFDACMKPYKRSLW